MLVFILQIFQNQISHFPQESLPFPLSIQRSQLSLTTISCYTEASDFHCIWTLYSNGLLFKYKLNAWYSSELLSWTSDSYYYGAQDCFHKILSLLGQLTAADTFTIHLPKICMQYWEGMCSKNGLEQI